MLNYVESGFSHRSYLTTFNIFIITLVLITTVVVFSSFDDSDAAGAEFTSGGFRYATTSSTTVELLEPLSESIVAVNVPSTIEYLGSKYSVTSIAEKAFYKMPSVKNIRIPETVTSIGEYAFAYCNNVTSIYYDVPSLIGNTAKNVFTEVGLDAESVRVTFGAHVDSVPDDIFKFVKPKYSSKNSKITSVTFEGNVKSIGANSFYHCNFLKSISLPNGLISIGDSSFYYCTALQSIIIPDSVTSIGSSAFEHCSGLNLTHVMT